MSGTKAAGGGDEIDNLFGDAEPAAADPAVIRRSVEQS